MVSMSKEYQQNYYQKNKEKLKKYYVENKEQFKNTYEISRDKVIDTDSNHYKTFFQYLNIICKENNNEVYTIDTHIYKNDEINSYCDENISEFKNLFHNNSWSKLIKSKKLPNQLLKRMLVVLDIPFQNLIKQSKTNGSHSYILINLSLI